MTIYLVKCNLKLYYIVIMMKNKYENIEISPHLAMVLDQLSAVAIFDKSLGKTPSRVVKGGSKDKNLPPSR